ncbi:hypothetical protein BTO02_16125 [Paraburkholderia sp. SOS3]|nr:hypothetical protein BTO02_16125 [Paraburkholderia sp. SOS3]
MSAKLAVVPIILSAKLAISRLPKLGGCEEISPFIGATAEPTFGVVIATLEGPCEIFDLHDLAKQGSSSVVPSVCKQISTGGRELPSDTKQQRNGDDFIAAMPEGRFATYSIAAKDIPDGLQLFAYLFERFSCEFRKSVSGSDLLWIYRCFPCGSSQRVKFAIG